MKVLLIINGMKTVHCVRAVFQALAGVPHVRAADVSMGRAEVLLEGALLETVFHDALSAAGYSVRSCSLLARQLPVLPAEAP